MKAFFSLKGARAIHLVNDKKERKEKNNEEKEITVK